MTTLSTMMRLLILLSLTTNGFSVGWNTKLSEIDLWSIGRAYPLDDGHQEKLPLLTGPKTPKKAGLGAISPLV